ncbi:MAG TPA: plastocyanin/azurin family copper-binding protein [Acidimicrobiia bacterium]|nr:plastocyanin/azurin family copper-binding protein [Acidimicrobiia bacterium]
MRGRRGWAAVLLAGVAGAAGSGPVLWLTATPAAAFATNVAINDKKPPDPKGTGVYNQVVTQIHVNDHVIWTNNTPNKHTVTSDPGSLSFDSGEIRPDGSYELKFTTAGTYTYHCTIHRGMTGRIEVTDPSATTTTTAAPPPTTATTAPAPPPTTAPAPPPPTAPPTTTTTAPPRPPAAVGPPPAPPVASSAQAPPPLASSSTTTLPSTTTTTAPPTTATSAPPLLAGGADGGPPPSAPATPPSTAASRPAGDTTQVAAGPPTGSGGHVDKTAVALVTALVAVGLFGLWTLIRVRPGAV